MVEGGAEESFTILLSYDGRFPQPWTRVNIPGCIVGIVAIGEGALGAVSCALSDEGDVYMITGSGVETTKTEGASIYSGDAFGYGPLNGLSSDGEDLWAYGLGGQLYRSVDGWRRVDRARKQWDCAAVFPFKRERGTCLHLLDQSIRALPATPRTLA